MTIMPVRARNLITPPRKRESRATARTIAALDSWLRRNDVGADHRRLDTLAGADEIDRLLREVAGALGCNQDQCAAAVDHQAALQQPERVGDHPRIHHILDGDRRFEGRAQVFGCLFALHDGETYLLL
jgi:hypothetical protein